MTLAERLHRNIRDPLLHPLRRRLYKYIQERPGASFLELLGGSGSRAYGEVQHHLLVLERRGLVTSRKDGRTRRYFAASLGSRVLKERICATLHPMRGRILSEVERTPGITQQQLAHQLRVSRQAVGYHVLRLGGLLALQPSNKFVHHFPASSVPSEGEPA